MNRAQTGHQQVHVIKPNILFPQRWTVMFSKIIWKRYISIIFITVHYICLKCPYAHTFGFIFSVYLGISCCTWSCDAVEKWLPGAHRKWGSNRTGWRGHTDGISAQILIWNVIWLCKNQFITSSTETGSPTPFMLCHMFRCLCLTQTVYVDLRWYAAWESASARLCLLFLRAKAHVSPSTPPLLWL